MLLLALSAILASAGAVAQVSRLLPGDSVLGKTGAPQALPVVNIDNKLSRLAPGGVIYDQQNRFLVHGQLPTNAIVLYSRNQAGDIQRMYILTDAEIQLALSGRR
jgi:hypothetical protein